MAKPKRLDYSEFMAHFGWSAYERKPEESGERIRVGGQRTWPPLMPPPGLNDAIQTYVPEFRVLAEAARRNCPSAFSQFLQQWLQSLGLDPPQGVFRPIRYGKPGRKEDPRTNGIYILWVAIGEPSLTSGMLAQAYYKEQFAAADAGERKQMVDRLRRAVERVQQRIAKP